MAQASAETNELMNKIASYGYVICSIGEGRLDPGARFAVADPQDNQEGFYLECPTLEELVQEAEAAHFDDLA
jgi:hypothetical protein